MSQEKIEITVSETPFLRMIQSGEMIKGTDPKFAEVMKRDTSFRENGGDEWMNIGYTIPDGKLVQTHRKTKEFRTLDKWVEIFETPTVR